MNKLILLSIALLSIIASSQDQEIDDIDLG